MTYDDLDDGVPNLDCTDDGDLEAARQFFLGVDAGRLGEALGIDRAVARDVAETLTAYCETARKARAARLFGAIAEAQRYEAANEARYARLPEGLRW